MKAETVMAKAKDYRSSFLNCISDWTGTVYEPLQHFQASLSCSFPKEIFLSQVFRKASYQGKGEIMACKIKNEIWYRSLYQKQPGVDHAKALYSMASATETSAPF